MNGAATLLTAIAALITSLGVIGGGIRFTLGRVDKRIDSLKKGLNECHDNHAKCEAKAAKLELAYTRQGVITRLAVEQLNLIDPNNIVSRQLAAELRVAFPFDQSLPDDVRALLTKLKGVPYP